MLTLTDEDIWKSFEDHQNTILDLFHIYIMQTDPTVQKSNDYNNFDIISLVSTDQFSVMLDILFEKLVKIGEFGNISVRIHDFPSDYFKDSLLKKTSFDIFCCQFAVRRIVFGAIDPGMDFGHFYASSFLGS